MTFLEKLTGGSLSGGKEENRTEPDSKDIVSKKSWVGDEPEGQLTIDVFQTPSDIVIKSTVAGVRPEELDIAITNDMVTVRGRRDKDENASHNDYFCQECYWGPFSRSIILPIDVEADKAMATLKNGILTIKLPKSSKSKTQKISVVHENGDEDEDESKNEE